MRPAVVLCMTIFITIGSFVIFSTLIYDNMVSVGFYLGLFALPSLLISLLSIVDLLLLCFYYGKDEDDRLTLTTCLVIPLVFTISMTSVCVGTRYANESGWIGFITSLEQDSLFLVWFELFFLLSTLVLPGNCASLWSLMLTSFYFYVTTLIIIPVLIAGCLTIVLEHKNNQASSSSSDYKYSKPRSKSIQNIF